MMFTANKKEEPLESFRQGFDDIPAIVGTGLPQLRRARYLLIQIADARAARSWLRELMASDVVHSLARVRARNLPKKKVGREPAPAHPRAAAISTRPASRTSRDLETPRTATPSSPRPIIRPVLDDERGTSIRRLPTAILHRKASRSSSAS